MARVLPELVMAPILVCCSTIASRRWSTRIGGVVSGFPAVVGPVLLIAAQSRGAEFAARAANGTLLGLVALGAFILVYGRLALRVGWGISLLAGWAAAALLAVLVGLLAGGLGLPGGLAVAMLSLSLAYAAMPRTLAVTTISRCPAQAPQEIPLRMAVTAALVAVLAIAANLTGSLIGGMLAGLPVLASVLAVFTHRRGGPAAVVALLRGMLSGMAGFVGFCAVVATLIVPVGTAFGFASATVAAIGLQTLGLDWRPSLFRRPLHP